MVNEVQFRYSFRILFPPPTPICNYNYPFCLFCFFFIFVYHQRSVFLSLFFLIRFSCLLLEFFNRSILAQTIWLPWVAKGGANCKQGQGLIFCLEQTKKHLTRGHTTFLRYKPLLMTTNCCCISTGRCTQ